MPESIEKLENPVGQEILTTTGSYAHTFYESNPQLSGTNLIGTYSGPGKLDDMIRQNPTVHIGLLSMLATMDSVDWEVRSHDKCLKSVKNFVEDMFFAHLQRDFKDVVLTVAKGPAFGVAPHEILTQPIKGKIYLKDLQYRPLRSFELWSVKLKDNYIFGEQQFIESDGTTKFALFGKPKPGVGWLHWPIFGEGLFGDSILRPIYNEHKEKEDIRKIRRIAIQKALFGTTLVWLKEDLNSRLLAKDKPTLDAVDDTLRNLSKMMAHENGTASVPPFVEKIESLFADSKAIEKAIEAENHADLQILLSFAYHWIGRGLFTAYGTNATAKTDSNEQRNIRRFFLNWTGRSFNPLIKWFVDYNFGPQKYYPYLYAFYTQEQSPTDITNNIAKLVANKIVVPDDRLEAHMRKINGVPDADPTTAREIEETKNDPETPGNFDPKTGEDTRDRKPEGDYT